MSDLQTFPIALPGGINQSAPNPSEQDLEELLNFAIFRNRVGLRAPIETIATIQDDQGSPADVNAILDIAEHQGKLWTASYSASQDDVYLHSMQVDGSSVTLEAVLWSSVVTQPVIKLVSFTGGDADVPEDRIYAVDYNQNLDTVYWEGSAVTNVTSDLDNSGVAENLTFSLMIAYKTYLWGTGFLEASTERPEMIRYSTQGVIPENDLDVSGTPLQSWHVNSNLLLGRRGDKIRALARAGDRLVAFQERSTHVIYGSSGGTWTRQELSDVIGCIGPHATATVDERVCYFWSLNGPYRTDGTQIQYIGTPIRQLATEVSASETDVRVGYSPDDGLVYFVVSEGGADEYSLCLVFDHRRERWLRVVFLNSATTNIEFGALRFLDDAAAPAPEAAPSSPSATATSDTTIDVAWTNGDTNVNTDTHVYRSTSSGFSPNDATNRVATLASGVSTYADTGLSADTTYYYKIRHIRNNTHSSESSEVNATTWLAEPTSVGLAGLTDGLKVTGTNNASGADIVIQRKVSGGTFSTVQTLSAPGGSFSYDDTGLTCGTEYFYRARAEEAGKTDSEWSSTVSREACNASTAPTAPSGLTATANGETQIDLSWTDNSDNEDSFEIQRSTDGGSTYSFLASNPANDTTYSDTSLDSNTEYYYRVRASNNAGDSAFATADNATTDPNLDAPTGVTATAISASQIDLAWTNNATDDTSIEIERSDDGGATWSLIATVSPSVASYENTGLSQSTTYEYRLRAAAGTTKGSYSSTTGTDHIATTQSAAAPTAPSSLTATQGSPTDSVIDVAWTDNSNDEDNFELYRDSGGGFSLVASPAANATSYSDTGLSPSTTYTYKIRAVNGNGNSAFSNEDSAATSGSPTVPADPTNLVATPDDADLSGNETTAVDLTWDDNADNEDNYIVERCTGASCTSWSQIASLAAGTTSYRDSSVTDDATANTIYRYRVKATNAQGDSAYVTSGDVTVEPQATPSGVSVVDQSFCDGAVAMPKLFISWDYGDTTGLEEIRLQRSKEGGSWTTVLTVSSSPEGTSQYTDTNVSFGSSYRYRVRADFGSTGENTGEFTSDASTAELVSEPDCSTEI